LDHLLTGVFDLLSILLSDVDVGEREHVVRTLSNVVRTFSTAKSLK